MPFCFLCLCSPPKSENFKIFVDSRTSGFLILQSVVLISSHFDDSFLLCPFSFSFLFQYYLNVTFFCSLSWHLYVSFIFLFVCHTIIFFADICVYSSVYPVPNLPKSILFQICHLTSPFYPFSWGKDTPYAWKPCISHTHFCYNSSCSSLN